MPKTNFNMNDIIIQTFLKLNVPDHKIKLKFILLVKEKCITYSQLQNISLFKYYLGK